MSKKANKKRYKAMRERKHNQLAKLQYTRKQRQRRHLRPGFHPEMAS